MKKIFILIFLATLLSFNIAFATENTLAISFTHNSESVELVICANDTTLINWGDGITENIEDDVDSLLVYEHTYEKAGTYTVTIADDVVQSFICWENKITSLDVTNSKSLVRLECGLNELTELDVSKNEALYSLECDYNPISNLDLRNNTNLKSLSCEYTPLENLDLSNNLFLEEVYCASNNDNFTLTLTIAQNAKLEIDGVNKNILSPVDVDSTKYEEAVEYLMENNVISGYPDNTFKPENTITRAEVSTIIAKFNKIDILNNLDSKFIDITNHWGKHYINALASLGVVSGYENNDFRPDNEVTYAEVTAMVLNSLGYKEEISKMNLEWPNNYISKATDMGLYKNLNANNPNKKMTRGDVAIFVYNVNNYGSEILDYSSMIKLNYNSDDVYIEILTPELLMVSARDYYSFGLINSNGEILTDLIYERMFSLSDKIIQACKNGKWGCIDEMGREFIPCIYDEISLISNIFIVKQNGKVGCIDKDGKVISFGVYDEIIEENENLILVRKDYKYGWINRNGDEVIPCRYNMRVNAFSEGMVGVWNGTSFGYMDTTGKLVIPYMYDMISEFYEGVALVHKNGKFKMIDKNGDEIIELNYDWVEKLKNGIVAVAKDEKIGMIDATGKEIVPFIYEDMKKIKDDFVIVKKDGKYGMLKNGVEVIPCIYENMEHIMNI